MDQVYFIFPIEIQGIANEPTNPRHDQAEEAVEFIVKRPSMSTKRIVSWYGWWRQFQADPCVHAIDHTLGWASNLGQDLNSGGVYMIQIELFEFKGLKRVHFQYSVQCIADIPIFSYAITIQWLCIPASRLWHWYHHDIFRHIHNPEQTYLWLCWCNSWFGNIPGSLSWLLHLETCSSVSRHPVLWLPPWSQSWLSLNEEYCPSRVPNRLILSTSPDKFVLELRGTIRERNWRWLTNVDLDLGIILMTHKKAFR